ncbi:hypothetical protein P3342_003618 [Pyrenophora teres f. teres]|nr:hypothetical protein P3342_003618 [Pyrenophora teres f. teres]
MVPVNPILYQNAEGDITLIDIPKSIAAAQGDRSDVLLSTAPLEAPIVPKEDYRPKTKKAKTKSLDADSTLAEQTELLRRPSHGEEEAMDVDQISEKELESRMREWASWSERKGNDTAFNLQQMMASLGATSEAAGPAVGAHKWVVSYQPASTLFLSDSTASDAFRTSFRELTDEFILPRHFDLVLLDPPWPNRSAKRKGAYEQVGGMPYLKKLLLSMDIDSYLEHNALVGVWITNKEALRAHVLGPGGLFEMWNVGLVEEWVWIKTTTKGEPMFDIDSAMRKPYEILLLGRAAPNSWTTMAHAPNIKRRVIAAVPDIHSRKPCLKTLLEPYLLDPTDYSALEIFSRYLVSGWTSWGNEVLKYNWHGYWASA